MEGRAKLLLESTVEESVTPETALDAGLKFGQIYKTVTVVEDSDSSSQMISNALMAGLMSAGAKIVHAGKTPVPVAHAASNNIILSVGNPDVNGTICGIKAFNTDGSPFEWDQLYDILKRKDVEVPEYKGVGQISTFYESAQKYTDKVKSLGIRSSAFVIVDCGCGNTSGCAPQMLNELGSTVTTVNAHTCKGSLPRAPGIDKNNLQDTPSFVNATIGSIGIGFNGDGTRIGVMDEEGEYITGEKLLALMLMYLEPTVAVIPFDSPCVVEEAFHKPMGIINKDPDGQEERKLIRCKNDIHSVIRTMKAHNADFGALSNGTFIFPQLGYCPDALCAAAYISELASKRSIRDLLRDIPVYSRSVVKVNFDGNMRLFTNKLRDRIKEYDIQDVCYSEDEWKMVLKKGAYIIKQNPMNPEKLLILAESSDRVYLITMLEQAKDIVNLCI